MAQKTKSKKPSARSRTYAHNRAASTRALRVVSESDGTYFLKLIFVIILGTLWIKLAQPISWHGVPFGGFPLGLLIGLALIKFAEKSQTDRKIWYAVLIVVAILSYFVPAGIVL